MARRLLIVITLILLGCSRGPRLIGHRVLKTAVETTVTTTSSGTVEARSEAAMGFTANGQVTWVGVRLGDKVKKGQVLARLGAADAISVSEDAKSNLSRARELFNSNLVSKAALDEAQKNYEVAKAALERTLIVAPFDGIIVEQNLRVGETSVLRQGVPMRILDLKPRIVRGNVDELELSKLQVGMKARVKIPALGPKTWIGTVERLVPYVSTVREQDRTSEIEIGLDEETTTSVPVGASADVEIVVASKQDAVAVLTRALFGPSEKKYLFTIDGSSLKKIPVQLGIGNYEKMEILSGLQVGQIFVMPDEKTELKEGLTVSVEEKPWP